MTKTKSMVYGYGEDANTLVIMTKYLKRFLDKIGDETPLDEVTVFFRPSFGRSSRTEKFAFGEFDAIVATCNAIYLVETKLYPAKKDSISLPSCQRLRHEIFHWCYENWKEEKPSSWQEFFAETQASFKRKFTGRSLPNPGTKLANNLESVLFVLTGRKVQIKNVLLLPTNSADVVLPPKVTPYSFEPVVIYVPNTRGNFVELCGGNNLILENTASARLAYKENK